MHSNFVPAHFRYAVLAVAVMFFTVPLKAQEQPVSLDPEKMPRIGTVDERFASYNIEMAEITGGNFWKPYHGQSSAAAHARKPAQSASTPTGMDPKHVSVSAACRSVQSTTAQTSDCARARLRARKWNLGELGLFRGLRQSARKAHRDLAVC